MGFFSKLSKTMFSYLLLAPFLLTLANCGSDSAATTETTGELAFLADGEGFVRDGFTSEDGWAIEFSNVFVHVSSPTAYQANTDGAAQTNREPVVQFHGGHPHANIDEETAHVALTGNFFIDLKQNPVEIGGVDDAVTGNYNQINFSVTTMGDDAEFFGQEGDTTTQATDYTDSSVVMIGTANDGNQTINFTIRLDEEIDYSGCGPNEDLGVVTEDAAGQAVLTFHFDHIFGDQEEGPADSTDPETVNYIAVGFQPFADLASGNTLDVTQADLAAGLDNAIYFQFREALRSMGHSGEAHCSYE